MKKLIAIGLLCFLIGCSESSVDESGRHVAKRSGTNAFNMVLRPGNEMWTFRYIMVDGHEYLVMTGCHRSGLSHSPNCPCQKNKLILDIAQPDGIYPPPSAIELVNTYTNNWTTNQVLFGGGI